MHPGAGGESGKRQSSTNTKDLKFVFNGCDTIFTDAQTSILLRLYLEYLLTQRAHYYSQKKKKTAANNKYCIRLKPWTVSNVNNNCLVSTFVCIWRQVSYTAYQLLRTITHSVQDLLSVLGRNPFVVIKRHKNSNQTTASLKLKKGRWDFSFSPKRAFLGRNMCQAKIQFDSRWLCSDAFS